MGFNEGQRLSYDGALCTVRYLGPLNGLKGEWIGVEWDRSARGKHNGQHQGERLFQCLSPSSTAASFIRSNRKPDPTRTLLEAIKSKYGSPRPVNGRLESSTPNTIEISGKTVEEVGFEKIQKQISLLSDLKIVLVDGLGVRALASNPSMTADAQVELAESCPNIIELDLGWNQIENWQDVADISASLKKLRILKVSGLRLRTFVATHLPDGTSPFESITELHLNESLLRPAEIIQLLSTPSNTLFPSLKTLRLSSNELDSFDHPSHHRFDSIKTLILENNKLGSLDPLLNIFHHFPNLSHLSLQDNIISTIGSRLVNSKLPSLTSLNIADNRIISFTFVDALPSIFPNLSSLRISQNPLYDDPHIPQASLTNGTIIANPNLPKTTSAPSSDSIYYLTLARIPTLLTLNYTNITPREREEGEIYYLSVAEKEIRNILSFTTTTPNRQTHSHSPLQFATDKYPLYLSLCIKYDRPNILSSPHPTSPPPSTSSSLFIPGSLGARLVTATFYILPSPNLTSSSPHKPKYTFTRRLPPSLAIHALKALVARHFGLPPLQFRLIHETGDLDPVDPIMETTTKLRGREGWDSWGDWDVDPPSPAAPAPDTGGGDDGLGREKDGMTILTAQESLQKKVTQVQGVRFKPRETEIKDGMRAWGDHLDLEVGGKKEVVVRVEPFDSAWEDERDVWRREEVRDSTGGQRG